VLAVCVSTRALQWWLRLLRVFPVCDSEPESVLGPITGDPDPGDRACKESCVRDVGCVYHSTFLPYRDGLLDETLKLKAEQLAGDIAAQTQTLDDLNALMRTRMKSALERMLDTELDVHLRRKAVAALSPAEKADPGPTTPPNRRNGHSHKTVRGELGERTLDPPRDRNGTFEPQLIAKHQRRLTGFDEKILALYAKGMTTRDIQDVVKELYGVDVSPTLVSEITADLDAEVTSWRQRRLDAVGPIVYLDGIVVPVRGDNGRVSQHTMYVAIGVNLQTPFLPS
jgi:putative transposase